MLEEGGDAGRGLLCLRRTALLEEDDDARRGQRCLSRVPLLEEDGIVYGTAFQEMASPGPVGECTMALAMSSGFRRVSESICKLLLELFSWRPVHVLALRACANVSCNADQRVDGSQSRPVRRH